MVEEPEAKIDVPVALVNAICGKVFALEVVAVKNAAATWPVTESLAYGEVVPMPTLPERYVVSVFGLNQYGAEVVPEPPIVMMSEVLLE